MMIDSLLSVAQSPAATPSPLVGLDDRLKGALSVNPNVQGREIPDADLEAFYQSLLAAGDDFDAYQFLKDYLSADGDHPFRTCGQQMEVLLASMTRLKENGYEGSTAYGSALQAYGKAWSLDLMIKEYMNKAIAGNDDEDSQEKVEW